MLVEEAHEVDQQGPISLVHRPDQRGGNLIVASSSLSRRDHSQAYPSTDEEGGYGWYVAARSPRCEFSVTFLRYGERLARVVLNR